jgi:hypothetical protein
MQSPNRAAEMQPLQESFESNPQVWVKPTLERLALKDAMAGYGGEDDLIDGHSS